MAAFDTYVKRRTIGDARIGIRAIAIPIFVLAKAA